MSEEPQAVPTATLGSTIVEPIKPAISRREEEVPTMLLHLKAPVELFERLDRWRLQQSGTVKPSRPASIRWIVHQFLLKQEQRAERSAKPKRKARR
jgi:hypothetical protein